MTLTENAILSSEDTFDDWTLEDFEKIPMLSQPPLDESALQLENAASELQFDDETSEEGFPSGDDPDFFGPPRVADSESDEFASYVGQLAVTYPDNTTLRAPAIVIGNDLVLSAGALATNSSGGFRNAVFIPGSGAENLDASALTIWPVSTHAVPAELEPNGEDGNRPYYDHNAFLNYGFYKLGPRYKMVNKATEPFISGHVGEHVGRWGIPKINPGVLPRDAVADGTLKLTWAGYGGDVFNHHTMYTGRGRYGGSLIKKDPQRSGNTPKGFTAYQGRRIPSDALALQMVNSRIERNNIGAPVMRKGQGSRWEVVGICVGTSEAGYFYSATFASPAFTTFSQRFQRQ